MGSMTPFHAWAAAQPDGVYTRIHRETGIAGSTLHRIKNGDMVPSYALARRLSLATGGKVTVEQLCGPSIVALRASRRAERSAAP